MDRFLIVGLGNPGSEYVNTRHNIGFTLLDPIADSCGGSFSTVRYGDLLEWRLKGRSVLLLKPSTFMNLSGKAVRYHLKESGIPLERLLVVTDDVALPFGKRRLRSKGSDGGHNGLKDIIAIMGRSDFSRLRIGIGNDYPKGRQSDFVLGQWTEGEAAEINTICASSTSCIEQFVLAGVQLAMTGCNKSEERP